MAAAVVAGGRNLSSHRISSSSTRSSACSTCSSVSRRGRRRKGSKLQLYALQIRMKYPWKKPPTSTTCVCTDITQLVSNYQYKDRPTGNQVGRALCTLIQLIKFRGDLRFPSTCVHMSGYIWTWSTFVCGILWIIITEKPNIVWDFLTVFIAKFNEMKDAPSSGRCR